MARELRDKLASGLAKSPRLVGEVRSSSVLVSWAHESFKKCSAKRSVASRAQRHVVATGFAARVMMFVQTTKAASE